MTSTEDDYLNKGFSLDNIVTEYPTYHMFDKFALGWTWLSSWKINRTCASLLSARKADIEELVFGEVPDRLSLFW